MRVWACTDHDLHWPGGGASIVIAETEEEARKLLEIALKEDGLLNSLFNLDEIDMSKAKAYILANGNY